MKKTLLLLVAFATISLTAQVTIFEDDFESYDDFIIENIGDWTQIDVDLSATYGANDVDFANEEYVGTGIIFNASAGTPDVSDGVWASYGGAKGLYFIAATSLLNDDYFISPQIDLTGAAGSSVSFWSKSLTDQYGLERFEVLVSTAGNTDVADFTLVSAGELMSPIDYTETIIDLSAYDGQQVYIALRYKAQDSFVWQVDDFKVVADSVAAVDDNILASSVNIYPTTADAQITINNRSAISLNTASIYDVNGRLIAQYDLNGLVGEKSINVSNISSGLYFVELASDNGKAVKKMIKK